MTSTSATQPARPPLRVTVWHEHVHDVTKDDVKALYPDGMHAAMKSAIEACFDPAAGRYDTVEVRTALLEEPEHGLTDAVLDDTDVLTWWGHCAHDKVDDAVAQKVIDRVRGGMGLVVLHSGHHSKPFRGLMGTTANLAWRVGAEKERLWILRPGHPLVNGLPGTHIDLPVAEMYGEPFDVPDPDELVLVSWFEGGEVFRSGCVWHRGAGRIVFLRPGHETYPIYHQPEIRQLLANAVQVAAPVAAAQRGGVYRADCPHSEVPWRAIGD